MCCRQHLELTFLVAQLVDKFLGARGYIQLLEHNTFNVLRPDALLVTISGRQLDLIARLIEGYDIEAGGLAGQMFAKHQIFLLELGISERLLGIGWD